MMVVQLINCWVQQTNERSGCAGQPGHAYLKKHLFVKTSHACAACGVS
jgi:hypothetical protein